MTENELFSKSLFFANEKGDALPLSVEEALSLEMTDFRGWHCAIGIENIHISPDGAIYGAACRNSGHLGNVYEQSYFLKKEWHVCSRKMCNCGADMQIRKVKDIKWIPKTFDDMPRNFVRNIQDPTYVAPVHQNAHRKHPLTLTWDLGRRCNYSCDYCNPSISNTYEAHKTWGSLMYAWEGLEKNFLKDRKAKFVFTGGEPTINPSYFDFVKMIYQKGHFIHTTTNGARLPDYYSELIEISFLGFSYHIEFAKKDHYIKLMKALIEKKQNSEQARNNWCGVRIMVPPGSFQIALDIRETLMAIDGFATSGIMIFMSPCYEKKLHAALMPYEPEELSQIANYA